MTGTPVEAVARLLLAPVLILAVAFLVNGYTGTGDGFAAGLVAALGVLVQYVAFGAREVETRLPIWRAPQVAAAGLVVVLGVAGQSLVRGQPLLSHWPPPGDAPAHIGAIELTTGLAFDVGIFMLVAGGALAAVHAVARAQEEQEGEEE